MHLGLGPDGHTASLVPNCGALRVRDRDVAISREYNGRRRMTLTYPAIDRAREALWVVTGEDKAEALAQLLSGDEEIPAAQGTHARPDGAHGHPRHLPLRHMQSCVLMKFGEIVLKGRNRVLFYAQLRRNVQRLLRDLGPLELRQRGGVLAVLSPAPVDELAERARDVLGVNLLHPALVLEKTPEAACAAAIDLLRDRPGGTFAIRARRRDKGWRLTSHELAIVVGKAVQDELGLGVDLTHPDLEVHLEVDKRELFAFSERIPGRGGLPVGVSGRAVCLVSGGIDSPVAAYRAMKRGLRCEFVHFSGRPFTGPESIYKAYAQVAQLDRFQGGSRLHVVPFGNVQRRAGDRGRRPPPGDRPAAADDAHGVGARRAGGRRGARHG